MKNFEVTGYFKYNGICEVVKAKTQKEALQLVLRSHNISYSSLLKMTSAENKKLLDVGIEPYTWIDFTVANVDAEFSLTGTGNWHINKG